MSATRNGKIARLPKTIRDDLGRRIENGEQGKELVEWLNARLQQHSEVETERNRYKWAFLEGRIWPSSKCAAKF